MSGIYLPPPAKSSPGEHFPRKSKMPDLTNPLRRGIFPERGGRFYEKSGIPAVRSRKLAAPEPFRALPEVGLFLQPDRQSQHPELSRHLPANRGAELSRARRARDADREPNPRIPHRRRCGRRPGYWEYVSPSLPVFHEEDHTFSCFCTPYDPNARNFYDALTADLERRSRERGILLGEFPPNLVHLSCLPWFPTTAFSLELQDAGCLAPVITWGRYESADGRTLLPVSLRLNHAAADGWHASLFLRLLEESAANFNILS